MAVGRHRVLEVPVAFLPDFRGVASNELIALVSH